MTPRLWMVMFVVAVASAAGVYFLWTSPLQVAVVQPTRGPAVEAVYATGTVEPVNWVKVAPEIAARIDAMLAREGDRVAKGQTLARLDDREARATVSQLEARVAFLKAELTRLGRLGEEYITRQTYEQADSELRQAKAALEAARHLLSEMTITTPIDGTILHQDGEIGEVVDKRQVLFWVGQPRPLRAAAEVDEEDIPRVREGQRALLKADAFPETALEGRVAEIRPKGDPINKSYRVRVSLPEDTPLQIGMTVEVNILVLEVPDAWLLPATAVANGAVWIVQQGRAKSIPVKTGIRGPDTVQILEGLEGDEFVIRQPGAELTDGATVRVVPPEGA